MCPSSIPLDPKGNLKFSLFEDKIYIEMRYFDF